MPIRAFATGLLIAFSWTNLLAASKRTVVVISDTHFGVGHRNGEWHPWEDFRWQTEFARFLAFIGANGSTDLVLNGDTFELWQSLSPCASVDAEIGCSQDEAVQRIKSVLAEHNDEIRALQAFASRGSNRIYVVPGNHDAAILFPAVRAEVERKLGANVVRADGEWRSQDHRILAVHGHQFDEANRFPNWPKPFTRDGEHLQRPWGEYFVQQFFNDVEERYPIVDNITREADGMLYGLMADGMKTLPSGLRFGRFIVFESSWRQGAGTAGGSSTTENRGKTEWDVKAIRHQGPNFFADSLPIGHPARAQFVEAAKQGRFDKAFEELTDDDVRAICDARAVRYAEDGAVSLCPDVNAGGWLMEIVDFGHTRLKNYLKTFTPNGKPDFDVAILSHTHQFEKPIQLKFDSGGPVTYVNTGAWQRVISAAEVAKRRKATGLSMGDVLKTWKITDLPACYPFVVIKPYDIKPTVRLRFWTQGSGDQWEVADKCLSTMP